METFFVFKVSCAYFWHCIGLAHKMKENILTKATELFLTYGFKSVTMDDIASKMGVSKKTIYAHFDNKNILVAATTDALFDTISSGIERIQESEKNPIAEMYKVKAFMMQHLKDEKSSPQYQLQKYYPEIYHELVQKQFDLVQECITKNLKRGIEQALFRKEIDVDFITRIYFKGMTGIKDADTFPQERFDMNYLLEQFFDYHFRGIATAKGIKTLQKTNPSNPIQ